ncbi:hypothetical protein [Carboxylicivirga sp. M1479]|uniref:hypothetical protein n=1 Tax=Carboxylicivirga sp. M1479 TaxID=2594476 RepID=UPI001178A638|nr:hypothetical protein [Carboxylicivirga sp. M1479]TRX65897.1 hypothetical protein FNN09_16545 [Carboxylicivirga sp. M1479]
MSDHQYINLFADCKIVRGFTQSVIIDLSRNKYYKLPNEFINVLSNYLGKTLSKLKADFDGAELSSIMQGVNL